MDFYDGDLEPPNGTLDLWRADQRDSRDATPKPGPAQFYNHFPRFSGGPRKLRPKRVGPQPKPAARTKSGSNSAHKTRKLPLPAEI